MEGAETDELRDFLSAEPGMLVGTAEMLRVVLKSIPVTLRIPDDTAVSRVHGNAAFEDRQEWTWRGNAMEWTWRGNAMEWITASTNPGMSLQIRPTRRPTPSTR